MTIGERDDRARRAHRRQVRAEHRKITVARGLFECSALLFAVGAIFSLCVAGRVGYAGWQDVRQDRAALHQARRDCRRNFDPTEWGTPEQQFASCVADSYTAMNHAHPIVFVILAAPFVLYLGITGLATWLTWDYRRRHHSC